MVRAMVLYCVCLWGLGDERCVELSRAKRKRRKLDREARMKRVGGETLHYIEKEKAWGR